MQNSPRIPLFFLLATMAAGCGDTVAGAPSDNEATEQQSESPVVQRQQTSSGPTSAGGGAKGTGSIAAAGSAASFTPLRQPPVVEYLINEAPEGAVGALHDAQPNPLDLPIVYASASPAFSTDSHGRALDFPQGDIRFAGAFSAPLDSGNKLRDTLHGSTTGTVEVLADVDWAHNTAYIFQLFGILQEDGENDDLSLWRWDDRLEYDFTGPGGYPAGYHKRSVALSGITPGPHLFHLVLDTDAAAPEDRLRLYVDGVRPPPVEPNEGGQTIPQGETLAIPRPSESMGYSGSAHDQRVSLGGIVNYAAGTGGFRGHIYYAAIHKNALTDAEIQAAPERIGLGD